MTPEAYVEASWEYDRQIEVRARSDDRRHRRDRTSRRWSALACPAYRWRHRRGLNRRRRVRCRGAETASSRPRERMTIGWARVRKDTPAAALRSPCADPLGAGGRVVSRRLVRTSMAGGRRDTLRALEIASGDCLSRRRAG